MLATTSVSRPDSHALKEQASPSLSGAGNLKQMPASSAAESEAPLQINPVLQYDIKAKVLLFQIVDPTSGEVEQQYPSEKQVEAYQKALEDQKEALPAPDRPEGLDKAPVEPPEAVSEADGPAVSGGPDVDPGQATREVSLVA